jgi:hypothetical protein
MALHDLRMREAALAQIVEPLRDRLQRRLVLRDDAAEQLGVAGVAISQRLEVATEAVLRHRAHHPIDYGAAAVGFVVGVRAIAVANYAG